METQARRRARPSAAGRVAGLTAVAVAVALGGCSAEAEPSAAPSAARPAETTEALGAEEAAADDWVGPADGARFVQGTATARVTGGDEDAASHDLVLATTDLDEGRNTVGTDPLGAREVELVFRGSDGRELLVRLDDPGLGPTGAQDVFVLLHVAADVAYNDPDRRLCEAEITALDPAQIGGTFSCTGLVAFRGAVGGETIDVEGTFTAST